MPATFEFHAFNRPSRARTSRGARAATGDIQLGTGHPQGGNPLSADADSGVVEPARSRVHDPRLASVESRFPPCG